MPGPQLLAGRTFKEHAGKARVREVWMEPWALVLTNFVPSPSRHGTNTAIVWVKNARVYVGLSEPEHC